MYLVRNTAKNLLSLKMSHNNTIILSILPFQVNNKIYMVCLETNIIVRADNIESAKVKMVNSLISYLATFKEQELLDGKYIRKAPTKYFVKWHLTIFLYKVFKLIKSAYTAEYNPHSKDLQLA